VARSSESPSISACMQVRHTKDEFGLSFGETVRHPKVMGYLHTCKGEVEEDVKVDGVNIVVLGIELHVISSAD